MLQGRIRSIHGIGNPGRPRMVSATRLPSGYTHTWRVASGIPWPQDGPPLPGSIVVPNITDVRRLLVGSYAPVRKGVLGSPGVPLAATCTPVAAAVSAIARWMEWNAADTAAKVTSRKAATTMANSTIV